MSSSGLPNRECWPGLPRLRSSRDGSKPRSSSTRKSRRRTASSRSEWRLSSTLSFTAADVQCHEGVEPCRLHHGINLDLLLSCADAPAAWTDLDGRYPELIVDVGIGPDACAVWGFWFDLFTDQVLIDLLRAF